MGGWGKFYWASPLIYRGDIFDPFLTLSCTRNSLFIGILLHRCNYLYLHPHPVLMIDMTFSLYNTYLLTYMVLISEKMQCSQLLNKPPKGNLSLQQTVEQFVNQFSHLEQVTICEKMKTSLIINS